MYNINDYTFEYDDIDWDGIKETFPMNSVLRDYMGINIHGNRCACPMHHGKHLSMQVFDTSAKCYSKCQTAFSIFDMVKYQDNLSSTYEAIIRLCNFYNVDPEMFDGIQKNEKGTNISYQKQDRISFPMKKNEMLFLGLAVNPFRRHNVRIKTGEETITNSIGKKINRPILKTVNLTDKECAYIVYMGLKEFNKTANSLTHNLEYYLYKTGHYSKDLKPVIVNALSFYKDMYQKIKEIGVEEPSEEKLSAIKEQYFAEKNPIFNMSIKEYQDENVDIHINSVDTYLVRQYEKIDLLKDIDDPLALDEYNKFLLRHGIHNEPYVFFNPIQTEEDRGQYAIEDIDKYLDDIQDKMIEWDKKSDWALTAATIIEPFLKEDFASETEFYRLKNSIDIEKDFVTMTLSKVHDLREQFYLNDKEQGIVFPLEEDELDR